MDPDTDPETMQAIIEDERDFVPAKRTFLDELILRECVSFVGSPADPIGRQPTPASYGEPWAEGPKGIIWSAGENRAILDQEPYEGNYWTDSDTYQARARAIQCVNACQGIADPVEALKETRKILQDVDTYVLNSKATPDAFDPAGMLSIRIHYALAKLNPA